MNASGIYKGYRFTALSTQSESGQYRARLAIVALDGAQTCSQRFLDLELFGTLGEANQRAVTVARKWIEENAGQDHLALPTNFAPFD